MGIERRVLENGLRVFIERKPIEECAAHLVVNAGWVNDTIPEISHFLEHLQACGSRVYGKRGVLNYVECNAFTDFQQTNYYFRCFFPEDLLRVLKNLSKVLLRPHMRWFEREREAVRNELNDGDCPETRLDERIFAIISPKHDKLIPSNRTSRLSLDKIDNAACYDFFNTFYTPRNSFLYVSGGLDSGLDEGLAFFGRIKDNGEARQVRLPVEPALKGRVEFSRKNMEKPFVKIAHQLPSFSSLSLKENIAKNVLFEYLGEDFGPLNRRLRDRLGVCYTFGLDVVYSGNAGEVILKVECNPDNFAAIEKEYLKTLVQISSKGISRNILDTFRKKYQIQSIHKASHFDLKRILNEINHEFLLSDFRQAVSLVNRADVAYVAQILLDRGYVVAKGLP